MSSAQIRTIEVNGHSYDVDVDDKGVKLTTPDGVEYRVANESDVYYLHGPENKHARGQLFAFAFGAYAGTHVLAVANSLDDALEEAAGWLKDHAPGHLSDLADEYKEALVEAREELGAEADEDEANERAQEIAETDMTYTGSGYLTSWEWFVDDASEELTEAFRLAVTVPKHWVSGSGMVGCLYDYGPSVSMSKEDAIDDLLFVFEHTLGKGSLARMKRDLETDGSHYFDRRIRPFAGADYCEISECDCQEWSHLESEE